MKEYSITIVNDSWYNYNFLGKEGTIISSCKTPTFPTTKYTMDWFIDFWLYIDMYCLEQILNPHLN